MIIESETEEKEEEKNNTNESEEKEEKTLSKEQEKILSQEVDVCHTLMNLWRTYTDDPYHDLSPVKEKMLKYLQHGRNLLVKSKKAPSKNKSSIFFNESEENSINNNDEGIIPKKKKKQFRKSKKNSDFGKPQKKKSSERDSERYRKSKGEVYLLDEQEEKEGDILENLSSVSKSSKRKNIAPLLAPSQLQPETKKAIREENEQRKKLQALKLQKLNSNDLSNPILVNPGRKEGEEAVYIPNILADSLKEHQIEGVKFMWENVVSITSSPGCLLAHAMGLGKTLTSITFIQCFIQSKIGNKILIIAPTSTIKNWCNEFEKWLDTFGPKVYLVQNGKEGATILSWFKEGGVLVIGYKLFTKMLKNEEDLKQYLLNPGPDLVILDEGHHVKSRDSKIRKLLQEMTTQRRICLTGYPIQNNLLEYYYMIDFLKPNFLGTIEEFRNLFENPIRNGLCSDSTEADKELSKKRAYVLNRRLDHFVLRKSDIILKTLLPPKTDTAIFVNFSPIQKELFQLLKETIKQMDYKQLIVLYHCMLHLSAHPDLFFHSVENPSSSEEAIDLMSSTMTTTPFSDLLNVLKAKVEIYKERDLSSFEHSAKLIVLKSLLESCKKLNEKALVFSQSTLTLDKIESMVKDSQYKYLRLDGSVGASKRQAIIDSFNNDESIFVFLISTRAGGLGINLPGASRSIIFDVSWNPCNDEQAAARIFRFGQKRPTFIYRLVSSLSLEKKVYRRQTLKNALSNEIVDMKTSPRNIHTQDVYQVFEFQDNQQSEPFPDTGDPIIQALKENCPHYINEITPHITDIFDAAQNLTEDQKQKAQEEIEEEQTKYRSLREKYRKIGNQNETYVQPKDPSNLPNTQNNDAETANITIPFLSSPKLSEMHVLNIEEQEEGELEEHLEEIEEEEELENAEEEKHQEMEEDRSHRT